MSANAPTWLEEILSRPTASVPDAARVLDVSRNHAYQATQRGEIPVIPGLRVKRVPTAWLKEVLRLPRPE